MIKKKKENSILLTIVILISVVISIFLIASNYETRIMFCDAVPDCIDYETSSIGNQIYIEKCGCEDVVGDFQQKSIIQRFMRNINEN